MIDESRINNTLGKMALYLKNHNSICVSISGGSDSDIMIHIIATYFREFLPKIHFVFADTGIEYRATLRHLEDIRQKYDIKIEKVKGVPIPKVVKDYGVPFLSKQISEYFKRLQRHGFCFENSDIDSLCTKYPGCSVALKWWCNKHGEGSRFNIEQKRGLKEFILKLDEVPPISAECCKLSKKKPMQDFEKSISADLVISGERKSEGGVRSTRHTSCFGQRDGMDLYMPLFFWNDDTKAYYKAAEGITYSDCYEVYGLKRTGCVGCPFARKHNEELAVLKKYEPQLYKACMNIFGESYRLTDEFEKFRKNRPITSEVPVLPGQIDIEDYIEEAKDDQSRNS